MLAALTDRARWLDSPWSAFAATSASEPSEVCARIAAHHGEFVLSELRRRDPSPLLIVLVDRASRDAWRFAQAAVDLDAVHDGVPRAAMISRARSRREVRP